MRGVVPKKALRSWFAEALAQGRVARVDVEGRELYARAPDVDDLAAATSPLAVRLLPAFDQYLLGPGTKDPRILDSARRADVSRSGGWIAPVVVVAGRVGGTWDVADGAVRIAMFGETPAIDADALAAEV